jgi:hypothetical protein
MAGSLIKIDEEIVTSAVASVTLGGADWDSSYDVYMVKYNNAGTSTDATLINSRVTVSGTPDTSANYDGAWKAVRTNTTFNNVSITNETNWKYSFGDSTGTGTSEKQNGIHYLFNFNNASEYSFMTVEQVMVNANAESKGGQGGYVHTVAQACDGIQLYASAGNIASGTFTLYGLKK